MKIGTILCRVKSCSSTNDLAREMASKGAEEGTVIISKEQTKGRGTKGRTWYSKKNRGLYLSIILRPAVSRLSLLPLMTALAVREAIYRAYGITIGLRWPNDLMWENRKLGGILCESSFLGNRLNYVVMGIGLNLSHEEEDFPKEIRAAATSLKLITGEIVDQAVLLKNLWLALNRLYSILSQGQGIKIVRSFEKSSVFSPGETIVIQTEKEKEAGIYRGIDSLGGLILETGGRRKSYFSAEIKAAVHD